MIKMGSGKLAKHEQNAAPSGEQKDEETYDQVRVRPGHYVPRSARILLRESCVWDLVVEQCQVSRSRAQNKTLRLRSLPISGNYVSKHPACKLLQGLVRG